MCISSDHLPQTLGHRMPVRRSEDQGLQPGRHPSPDRQKVELVGRSPCPGHGMGCKGGIHQARNTETASKVSWAIRQIHLPHWSRRNRKAPANTAGTSLPTLAQNQAENRMSRVQGSPPIIPKKQGRAGFPRGGPFGVVSLRPTAYPSVTTQPVVVQSRIIPIFWSRIPQPSVRIALTGDSRLVYMFMKCSEGGAIGVDQHRPILRRRRLEPRA